MPIRPASPRPPRVKDRLEFWSLIESVPTCLASISLGANRHEFQHQAMRWSYIVRQRGRWSQDGQGRREIAVLAEETLDHLGIGPAPLQAIQKIGKTDLLSLTEPNRTSFHVIEVRIPWLDEDRWWEARVMPWEHLLAAVTRESRGETSIAVIRQLIVPRGRRSTRMDANPEGSKVQRFGMVTMAPGALRGEFDFSNESRWIRDSLKRVPQQIVVDDPDRKDLQEWIGQYHPNVLHLSGIDIRLASQKLSLQEADIHDGIAIRDRHEAWKFLYPQETAELLVGNNPELEMLGLNLWNSAARIAPLAIARGAKNALSFEHSFNDEIAELFFSTFYRRWSHSEWNTLDAFLTAIASTKPYANRVRGGGFVLWSKKSLLNSFGSRLRSIPSSVKENPPPPVILDPSKSLRDYLTVEVEVDSEINYALLHNRQSLLKKLILRWRAEENVDGIDEIHDIDVSVQLFFGSESFPYTTRVGISSRTPSVNLADPMLEPDPFHGVGGIHIPLLSQLPRGLQESALTSVEVIIRWHHQTLYHQTFPVRMAPIDQWRFEDRDAIWLPSFVQPRDPAVAEIVRQAQRYLISLRDDTTVGFDGYQALGSLSMGDHAKGIEDQVRALWSALLIDHQLHYINPPPSYSTAAQRLRTPSQTIGQGRGTCIDLALLFAACLEWVEIYPILMLLDDHAFVGYWRDLDSYWEFTEPKIGKETDRKERRTLMTDHSMSMYPWYVGRSAYSEIREQVLLGKIVPLETVSLTNGDGYSSAVQIGKEYFESRLPRSFHSMIDIARSRPMVTPLPL